jgi:hypothetical protein
MRDYRRQFESEETHDDDDEKANRRLFHIRLK